MLPLAAGFYIIEQIDLIDICCLTLYIDFPAGSPGPVM